MFIYKNTYKILLRIVRKIFSVGAFDVSKILNDWKEFTNHIYRLMIRKDSEISKTNIFRPLLSVQSVITLIESPHDRRNQERFAHLKSSRHFPCGSDKEAIKAMTKFHENTSAEAEVDADLLCDLYRHAFLLGKKVKKKGMNMGKRSHISLAASASYAYTVEDGGRAQEIIDVVKPILCMVVPENMTEIKTPWKVYKVEPGYPFWASLCRVDDFDPDCLYPAISLDRNFGDSTEENLLGFYDIYKWGYDEKLGEQIFVIAYLYYEKRPIFAKYMTVPEPGGKARIVSTSEWWNMILQQPLAHVLTGYLGQIPQTRTCLTRSDQAWAAIAQLNGKTFPDTTEVLSSDLSEATDRIPLSVVEYLLRGFTEGLNEISGYIDLAISLVTRPRLMEPCSKLYQEMWLTKTGIPMGEPLAKVVLLLQGLVVDRIALTDYIEMKNIRKPKESIRYYHLGGDDHLAIGPNEYLDKLTEVNLKLNASISQHKHGRNSTLVFYCEKVLSVPQLIHGGWKLGDINRSTVGYEKSPFVDSIKVRLISPESKSTDTFNDKNSAIGKGRSLGRTLKWLNKDHFPEKWVNMVRDRFFQRMRYFLPSRESGVYWHLLLPENCGGLNLGLESDIPNIMLRLPNPSKNFLIRVSNGIAKKDELSLFRRYLQPSSFRGYCLGVEEITLLDEIVTLLLQDSKPIPWYLARKIPPLEDGASNQQIARALNDAGYWTFDEVRNKIARSNLFTNLFMEKSKVEPFHTKSLKKRYAELWDVYLNGNVAITRQCLEQIYRREPENPYYFVQEKVEIPFQGRLIEVPLINSITYGTPSLTVDWESKTF